MEENLKKVTLYPALPIYAGGGCHGSHTFDFSIGDGGSMGLVSIPGTSSVLSIEDFFPVFDAAKSIVVRTDFKVQDGCLTAKRVQFNPLPYCHRITVVSEEDGLWIVCGILCQHKAFIDDWSTPGSIMVAKLTEAPLSFIKIKDDIGKNHVRSREDPPPSEA